MTRDLGIALGWMGVATLLGLGRAVSGSGSLYLVFVAVLASLAIWVNWVALRERRERLRSATEGRPQGAWDESA